MKKGVALLITIGFLTVLTALIGYMFSISKKTFDEVNRVEIRNQSSIIFSDVKVLLDSYAKDVKDSEDLSNFLLGTPLFYDKKSGLFLQVKMNYLSNKVNINSILIKNKTDNNIVLFLQNICETYNILDSSFFIALLLDTIDEDEVSRQALSEISRENIKFSNLRLIDMSHFETLLDYYTEITKDDNIKKVPWGKLIYFGDTQKNIVDCDKMSKELINAFRLSVEDFSGCADLEDEENKKIAIKYNLKEFNKKDSYFIDVNIFYTINEIQDETSFIYDIKTNYSTN